MLRYDRKLDTNIHVLEWDLKRNNEKIPVGKLDDLEPGSTEWKRVQYYKERYTAFNNMLRYTRSLSTKIYHGNHDEAVKWDLEVEYGYEHTDNLTTKLYEEREKELKGIRKYQETKQKLAGVGISE